MSHMAGMAQQKITGGGSMDSTRVREIAFHARRILLRGGYSVIEVDGILDVVLAALAQGQEIDYELLLQNLIQNGLPPDIAASIAREIAPAH